ncbi:unnamed protein product, partial [Nesidiocoris tenuis]
MITSMQKHCTITMLFSEFEYLIPMRRYGGYLNGFHRNRPAANEMLILPREGLFDKSPAPLPVVVRRVRQMTTEKLRKVRQETLHHHADWSAEEDGRGRKLLFRCRPPPGGRSPSPRMKGTVAPDFQIIEVISQNYGSIKVKSQTPSTVSRKYCEVLRTADRESATPVGNQSYDRPAPGRRNGRAVHIRPFPLVGPPGTPAGFTEVSSSAGIEQMKDEILLRIRRKKASIISEMTRLSVKVQDEAISLSQHDNLILTNLNHFLNKCLCVRESVSCLWPFTKMPIARSNLNLFSNYSNWNVLLGKTYHPDRLEFELVT